MNIAPTELAAVRTAAPVPTKISHRIQNFFWWFAGADSRLMRESCSTRTQMMYSALGIVFLSNFCFLVTVWCSFGKSYFGLFGALIMGATIPSVLVLGVDRLTVMRTRKLTGDLAIYNTTNQNPSLLHLEVCCRIAIAFTLSCGTTFAFLMEKSEPQIAATALGNSLVANKALREEMLARINAEDVAEKESINARLAGLAQQRDTQQKEYDAAAERAEQAAKTALVAGDEAARQRGGLDGRIEGEGPKFRAQSELATRNQGVADAAREHADGANTKLQGFNSEIADAKKELFAVEAKRNERVASLVHAMEKDARFVSVQRGLFADATNFLSLYADPHYATGMIISTLIALGVLLSMELGALLGLALLPINAYDVACRADCRVEAASIVAASEVELVRQAALRPEVLVARPDESGLRIVVRPVPETTET